VLLLQEERCRDEPPVQLARTFAHLGLPTDAELAPSMVQPPPTPRDPGSTIPESIRRAFAVAVAVEFQQLAEVAPDLDLARWTIPDHGG
jgi:hypothetical protein